MQVKCVEHGCNNKIEDTVIHGTYDSCVKREEAMWEGVEVCPAHNLVLGEGAPCAACEQAAHNQYCGEAFAYIDAVVRGRSINHVSPSQRTPGQHIAFLCICLVAYGATSSHIIEQLRLRNIPGSTETVQAVLDYLK